MRRVFAPLGLLAAVAHSSTLGAQEVLRARLEAEVRPDGTSSARVAYELAPNGLDSIPLLGVSLLGARVSSLTATLQPSGAELPVRFGEAPSGALTGAIRLDAASPTPDSILRIALSYEVSQPRSVGADFDLTLPIVFVDWAPAPDRPELFAADFGVPSDYALLETFPLVPLDPTPREDLSSYSITLPIVPSMLRLRGHVGDRPFLTFARLVDLGVGLVILILGLIGWHAMRHDPKARAATAGEGRASVP